MGTSTAVERLKKSTPELTDIIKSQMKAMDDSMAEEVAKFAPFVDEFYSRNKWDQHLFGQEVRKDVQQESTFSLDMISKAIKTIAEGVIKGDIGSLVGADGNDTLKKAGGAVSADIAKVPSAADFMIEAAIAAVTSVMGLFNSRATSHVGIGMESHRVAPGLSLHAYSYSAIVNADAATGSESIVMTAVGYRLIYSFAQAEVEQGMALMEYYTKQMTHLEKALEVRQEQIDDLIEDPDTSMDDLTKAQNFIALASGQLDKYKEKADELAKQYEAV